MKPILFTITLFSALICYSFTYNTTIASDLAHFANIAYESQTNINAWNCSSCAKVPLKNQKAFFSSVANIQGFAGHFAKENAIIVSFRGSVDFKNWIYNLDSTQTNYPSCTGCYVHSGFYSAYKGVSPLVRAEVDRLKNLYKTSKLVITGHSLGGSMAILCALQMKQVFGTVNYVYTYGQPRVGNQNFATFYESRISQTFRVVNYADLVPHVPPAAMNFKHGGQQIWYHPRGMKQYTICQAQSITCSNSLSATTLTTDDHSMSIYMTLPVTSTEVEANLRKQVIYLTVEELNQMQLRKVNIIKELIGIELQKEIKQ